MVEKSAGVFLATAFFAIILQSESRGISQVGFSIYKDKEAYRQAGEGNESDKVVVTYAINHPTNQGDIGDASLTPVVLSDFSLHDQHQQQISSYVAQQQLRHNTNGGRVNSQTLFKQRQPYGIQQRLPTSQAGQGVVYTKEQGGAVPSGGSYFTAPPQQIQQRPDNIAIVPPVQFEKLAKYAIPPPLSSQKYKGTASQSVSSYMGYTNLPKGQGVMVTPEVRSNGPSATSTPWEGMNSRNIIGLEQRLKIANAQKSIVPVCNQDLQIGVPMCGQYSGKVFNDALDTNAPLEFF